MGEDVVEGGLHVGEKRRDVLPGEGRVEHHQPAVAAALLDPDIGVVRVAMGGDRAAGEAVRGEADEARVEQAGERVGIVDAVDAPAKRGEIRPRQA